MNFATCLRSCWISIPCAQRTVCNLQPPWFGANGIHLGEVSFVAISDWLKLPMLQDFQSSNFPCRGRERSQVSEHNRRRRCAGRICLGWVESIVNESETDSLGVGDVLFSRIIPLAYREKYFVYSSRKPI